MALQPNLGYMGLGNPVSAKGSEFFKPANIFDFDNLGSANAIKNLNIAKQTQQTTQQGFMGAGAGGAGALPVKSSQMSAVPKMTSLREMENNVRSDLLSKNPDMAALKQQVDQKQKYMIDFARKSFGLPADVTDDKILSTLMKKKPEIIDQFFAQDFANLKEIKGRTGMLLGAQALPDNIFNRVVTKPLADTADLLYRGVYGSIDNANAGIANAFGRDFEKTTDLNTQDSLAALAGGASNTFGIMAAPWLNLGLGLAQETEPGRQLIEGTIGKVIGGIQESAPFQGVFGGSPDRFQMNAAGAALDLISPVIESVPGRAKSLIKKTGQVIDDTMLNTPATRNVGGDITTAIRPSVASTKVGGLEGWEAKAVDAFKDIVARKDIVKIDDELVNRSPENLKELAEAIPQVKKDIYDEYTSRANALGDDVRMDYTPVVDELKKALADADVWEVAVPGIKDYINGRIAEFQRLTDERTHSIPNTQELKQIMNAKLQAYFKNPNPNDVGKNTVDAMINNIIGETLDNTIEKGLGDSGYGELKKSYGNLRAIEKDVKHRATVDARKSKSGFFDLSDVFTAGQLADAITSMSSAGLAKAAVMYGVKEFLKGRNDPNRRIKRIFKTLDQQVAPYDRSVTKNLVDRANEFAAQKAKEEAAAQKKAAPKKTMKPAPKNADKSGVVKEGVKKGNKIEEAVKKKYQRATEDSPITKAEAESIVRKYFSKDEVGTMFVDALTTPEKAKAFGAYADAMIQFAKDPMASTPEHEVVHAYMDMFSPNRDAILNDVMKRYSAEIEQIKSDLDIKDTREAAEEWLADNFVKYAQGAKTFTGALKQFFQNLWNNVKRVFGQEDKIMALYQDIVNRKRPQSAQPNQLATSKFMADGERLAVDDAKNNLSVKFLENINNEIKKDTISAQYLENYAKRPELKKPEKRILEDILRAMPGDSISKADFIKAVKSELLDLKVLETDKWADYNSLRDQEGYSIDNRATRVYEAPFIVSKDAATHFGDETPNYFAHSRTEDIGDTRRVIEIQSDLFQRRRYEKENVLERAQVKLDAEENNLNFLKKDFEDYMKNGGDEINAIKTQSMRERIETSEKKIKALKDIVENPVKGELKDIVENIQNLRGTKKVLEDRVKFDIDNPADRKWVEGKLKQLEEYSLDIQRDIDAGLDNIHPYRDNIKKNRVKNVAEEILKRTGVDMENVALRRGNVLSEGGVANMDDFRTFVERQMRDNEMQIKSIDEELKGLYEKRDAAIMAFPKKQQWLQDYANNWYERVIREEIAAAAKEGKEKIQLPMPDAIARIEGYTRGGDVPEGQEVGNTLDIGGSEYIVVRADGNGEVAAVPRDILNSYRVSDLWDEEARSRYDDVQGGHDEYLGAEIIKNGADKIDTDWFNDLEDADEVKSQIQEYIDSEDWEAIYSNESMRDILLDQLDGYDYVYDSLSDNFGSAERYAEYWNDEVGEQQVIPDGDDRVYTVKGDIEYYIEYFNEGSSDADMSPDDISWADDFDDEQKAVVEFYHRKIIPYAKKIRKDAEVVEEDGVHWLNVPLKPEDATNPVMAYQRGKNLIRRKKTQMPKVKVRGKWKEVEDGYLYRGGSIDELKSIVENGYRKGTTKGFGNNKKSIYFDPLESEAETYAGNKGLVFRIRAGGKKFFLDMEDAGYAQNIENGDTQIPSSISDMPPLYTQDPISIEDIEVKKNGNRTRASEFFKK